MLYESDEQLSEALQTWTSKNKFKLAAYLLLLFAIVFGIQTWNINKQNQNIAASNMFNKTIDLLKNNKDATVNLDKTIHKYNNSVYAGLSQIISSKIVFNSNIENSIAQLQNIIKKNIQPAISDIARLKLARIYLYQNQPNKAQATLNTINKINKKHPITLILLGDINFANNSYKQALWHYTQAQNTITKINPEWQAINQYINAKINLAQSKIKS